MKNLSISANYFKTRVIAILTMMLLLVPTTIDAQVTRRTKQQTNTTKTTKTVKPETTTNTNTNIQMVGTLAPIIVPFESLVIGSPWNKGGMKKLTVINNNFTEKNNSSTTNEGKNETKETICFKERLNIEANVRDFSQMPQGSRPDWLKPGIVMKANSFVDGSYQIEERYNRSPINLSVDLRGASQSVRQVPNPRYKSNILNIENQLISQNANHVPANMSFKFHEIRSLEELDFKLNGRYSGGFGAFGAEMGLSYEKSKSSYYYMVEFTQQMFQMEVDGLDASQLFADNAQVPTQDYVYISKVNYGRRGVIIFKSEKSFDELKTSVNVKSGFLLTKASLNTFYSEMSQNEEVKIEAFLYGGSSVAAINSIVSTIKNGKPDIAGWLAGRPFDHKLALPISFEIKNLNNQKVGMESSFIQNVQTCIEKRNYKLKMSLTDIQNIKARDGVGANDDYGIQMAVVYSAKGKRKTPVDSKIRKFPGLRCGFEDASRPHKISGPYIPIICGGMNNQIHVREDRVQRWPSQINNTVTFNVSYEDITDPKASFTIYTWFKEYTSGNDKVMLDANTPTEVPVAEIIQILTSAKQLNGNKKYYDGAIAQNLGNKFKDFGPSQIWLTTVPETNKIILEGPLRAGDPSGKAAIWVRFELEN